MRNISSAIWQRLVFAGVLSVAGIAAVACANGSAVNPDQAPLPQTVAQRAEPEPSLLRQNQFVNPASEPSGGEGSPAASSGDLAANGDSPGATSDSEASIEAILSGEGGPAAAMAEPESSPADVTTASRQETTPTPTDNPPTVAATEPTSAVEPEFVPEQPALKSSKEVNIDFSLFQQLIPRNQIAPIYEPKFVAADQSPLPGTELVIGVELNGESRAYPVGPLNNREMVNDVVGGIPILVSW